MSASWDLWAALTGLAMATIVVLRTLWAAMRGNARSYQRVDRQGGSPFLGKSLMNAGYASMLPMGRFLAERGVSPDGISWLSLFLGLAAGVLLAVDLPGSAGLLLVFAGTADAIDGMVARLIGRQSNSGVVLDSSLDRYVDFFMLAGIAVAWRDSLLLLCAALGALLGSFMISYSSAKAEAMSIEPPRGWMKRSERFTYLTLGALLAAPAALFGYGQAPLITVVVLIAVVANISAVSRLATLYRAARKTRIPHKADPGRE